jgi:hypothetical protein
MSIGSWSTASGVLVIQHGQHARQHAQVAAAKLGLSTLVNSSADAAAKVQRIIGILDSDYNEASASIWLGQS